jgi:hypothetical protein
MAKTAKDDEKVAVAEKAPAPVKRDPFKVIGLESGVPGEYRYVEVPAAFEVDRDADGKLINVHVRRILFEGANFEHTAEDGDGCWIYRQM